MHRRIHALLTGPALLLGLAAGCPRPVDTPPPTPPAVAPAPAAPAPIAIPAVTRFAWDTPGSVHVDVLSTQVGHSIAWSFTLTIATAADGRHRIVRFDRLKVHTTKKLEEYPSGLMQALASLYALIAAGPEISLDPAGVPVDVTIKPPEALRVIFPFVVGQWRPELAQPMTEAVARPEFRAMQVDRARARWNGWVGAWVDFPLTPGTRQETEERLEGFGDVALRRTVRAYAGPADLPGHVRLISTTITDMRAPAMHRFVQATLCGDLSNLSANDPPLSHVEDVEVITDPRTLRPRSVRVRTSVERMGPAITAHESVYTFRWAPAGG